nr:phenylalanine--tRNA ligase subunit alpha [Akkermansia muciniphila]
MMEEIVRIQRDALARIAQASDRRGVEDARVAILGKKGELTLAQTGMKDVPREEKPAVGQLLNEARKAITEALDAKLEEVQAQADKAAVAGVDLTLPARSLPLGGLHPLTIVRDEAVRILRHMGFALADGPEIEDEFHCFDALNTPEDHPARNEKDTFYFDSGKLLRTHTSSVQIRSMEKQLPPVRVIAPGSAYRRDEIDATHLSAFNQLEGLYVDTDVSVGDLKGTLEYFLRALFGSGTEVRFRPHFFPFTEPSFEIDVKLKVDGQAPRWVEIAGCGMVDPNVFEAVDRELGLDPGAQARYTGLTGFAFGIGLDRLAMIRWGIRDIRALIENDVRFLAPIPIIFTCFPVMKISLNWLSQYIDLSGLSVDEMSDMLTFAGIEVEDIRQQGVDSPYVVVARVAAAEQHPQADRLKVCQVDVGDGTLHQIVCGAQNYKVGDKVPCALPGAVLPGNV